MCHKCKYALSFIFFFVHPMESALPFSVDGHLHSQLNGFSDLGNSISVGIKSQPLLPVSLHVILDNDQYRFISGFIRSGFVCHNCVTSKRHIIHTGCKNCSLCPAGTYIYNDENHCLECFAGSENDHLFHCK